MATKLFHCLQKKKLSQNLLIFKDISHSFKTLVAVESLSPAIGNDYV
jgi:hypothetical protein